MSALPSPADSDMARAGQEANLQASKNRFAEYRKRRAVNTLRRQSGDLALFSRYLNEIGVATTADFANDPDAWSGVTWGLVDGFVRWQLNAGYAVPSVNVRLSTIKTYAKLAMKAGTLMSAEFAQISAVEGYSHKEEGRLDRERAKKRVGAKKAVAVSITLDQARALKREQPDTPQGHRDALMMSLLLDHGLRVGELANLWVTAFDPKSGLMEFMRPKVDKLQIHRLSSDTRKYLEIYFNGDAPAIGPLLRSSKKDGTLAKSGMGVRAICAQVRKLGEVGGLEGLSPHDCRHYWASNAARAKGGTNNPFLLQEAGGWNSLVMPRRYIEAAKISNEGLKLDE